MSKFQEYKCPKCLVWDDGFPIKDGKMNCNCCNYWGKLKEFEAKRYFCYAQVIVVVIGFNKEDAKKEFDIIIKEGSVDLESSFDKLIKIVEAN